MTDMQKTGTLEQRAPRGRKVWRRYASVFLLYLLLAVVMTYPLAFRLADTVINYGDPLLNTWIMAWDIHALETQPFHLFNANNFHPYENTLAYSENLLTTALLAAPWIWLTGNPVLAHNAMMLLSFALGGFCAYLLIERLTGHSFGGFVGGVVFAFAHYRFGQISHIQLLTSWWIPLALYYLERFLDERRSWDLAFFTACFIGQVWATIYLGIFLGGAVALYLLYDLLTEKKLLKDQSLSTRLGVAGLVIAVALGLLYVPYSRASEVVGTRELGGQNGAALRDYLSAHPGSLPGKLEALKPVQESPEHTLFPGFVGLGLAFWGILKGSKNRKRMSFYLTLGVISLILSFGPHLHLTRDQAPLLEGLPYAAIYRYIPFMRAIRVPARLALLVMLSLAVLAGFGAAAVARASRQHRWIWYGLIAAGLLLDYGAAPLALVPIEIGSEVPSVYRWLGEQRPDSVIFEFPTAESPDITGDEVSIPRLSRHQYFSTYHWQRLTMGYSGFYPPLFWESLKHSLHFPSHESLTYLRGLEVDYVLIHKDELSNEEYLRTRLGLQRRSSLLSEAGRHGETEVYHLPPGPSVEPDLELSLPPTSASEQPYYAYILLHLPDDQGWISRDRPTYQLSFEWQPKEGEAISGDVRGQLPRVLGSGTTVLPLSISSPTSWPASLRVHFTALSKTVNASQAVEAQHENSSIGMEAIADNLDFVGRTVGNALVLTHAHFPRGRTLTAGDPLSLVLYWRQRNSTEQRLTTYTHILNQAGLKVAQLDTPLSSVPVFERQIVSVQWDLPPGTYDVVVGIYDTETHQAVGNPVELGSIQIEQPALLKDVVQGPASFKLGENVELLGYDLQSTAAGSGREVTLTLYWLCRGHLEQDYTVFTHLLSEDGQILDQQDSEPRDGRHPTSSWRPEEIVVDRYRLEVPANAQAGPYSLAIGMYLPASGERLPILSADGNHVSEDRILLKSVQVIEGN